MKRVLVLVPLLFALTVTVGCASATRKLAIADYQLAESAKAAQQTAETAQKAGLVSAPEYRAFLTGVDKVAAGGHAFTQAFMAYLAAGGNGSTVSLLAAFNSLVESFTALPSPLTGSAQTQVQTIVNAQAPQTAITNAQKALGVK